MPVFFLLLGLFLLWLFMTGRAARVIGALVG
jgi:hypothetical protein